MFNDPIVAWASRPLTAKSVRFAKAISFIVNWRIFHVNYKHFKNYLLTEQAGLATPLFLS